MEQETTQIVLEDILLHADKTAQEQLDVMNAQLEAQANTMQAVEEINSKLNDVQSLDIRGIRGEKGERGGRFLGGFNTPEDLPENASIGDSAYINSTGELWYVYE